jgi:hypothetical protein
MTSTHSRRSGVSRRGFVLGAGLAVLGAGGGVAVGLLVDRTPDHVTVPRPRTLLAAAAAERTLLAQVDAALAGDASLRTVLRQVRADHAAHLAALTAAVELATGAAASSGAASGSGSAGARVPRPAPSSRDQLRAAEAAAASAGAQRALALTGRDAALLASISACEATHAELLA